MNPRNDHPDNGVHESSTMELVGGLVTDTRDLVEAHVSAAKLEIKGELKQLATAAKQAVLGAVLIGVAAILTFLAIAQALAFFLDVPFWAGHAIVALVAVAIGVGFTMNAKKVAGDADGVPERELDRAKHDLRWAAKRASAAAQPKP